MAHVPSHHETGDTHADGDDHPAHVDAAEVPPPTDEPKTPLWLTALGGGLFVVLAIAWLAARPAGRTLSELTPPAPATQAAAPAPAPVPAPAPAPPPAIVPTPVPAQAVAPAASASVKKHKKKKAPTEAP